ncbi:zinc finger protein 618 isoform X1 [Oncorhynchus kisutch]|uniref:Zinc finger protein 618 n=1 Tax=Oncorhynchus kisutch TaxID=8019 RepID=A0A8C7FCX8_ONCKI|nr:zinc finger protein 618 isoform X1 [Oncorhynchus kisutch]XP_020313186.1 zinc finger protein 618 isoform X1 [Oncorhynchus kisutch]
MSAQEVPTNPGQEQVDAGGGVPDGPSPTTTTTLAVPVTIKKEPDMQGASNGKDVPAEICVVLGGGGATGGGRSRNDQTQGSYVCGICGKKYKYYNCFQTHVRAHRESDSMPGEGAPTTPNNSFRYSCDICGKKYKYYSCFQEHRDLHAVDDPYEQVVLGPVEDVKEEEPVEPFQKVGPKTGSYECEFCGKQYKYFNPYQEHVALHQPMNFSFDNMKSPRSRGSVDGNMDVSKYSATKLETDSPFSRKMESKTQSSLVDTNSSQNSSGTPSPLVAGSFPASQITKCFTTIRAYSPQNPKDKATVAETKSLEPYTCGACGIPFQFYNNLLEHMQSHAADNENHTKGGSPKTSPGPASQDQLWRSPQPQHQAQAQIVQVQIQAQPQPTQRNHYTNQNSGGLPEKERQQVAERLLRVMCTDLGVLNMLNSKDFLKLAQTLVDTGARHGAYSTREALGNMSSLALRQLPRMYNQIKVKVTCALGSNTSLGIAVTCHSQTVGPDACLVLTAYQVEGSRLKRYVLGVKEADLREGPEQVHQWTQNVLSEFVMSDIRTVYVTEPRVSAVGMGGSPLGGGGRGRVCLRCAGCSLGVVVQAVLGKRSLQARGLHELTELLATCRDIAASTSLSLRDDSTSATIDEGTSNPSAPPRPSPTPPCWDRTAEALLQVHAHFEQICEAYGRSKATASTLQGLNKHLLGTLACLLAPLRLAALELSSQRRPTLQQVLPVYLRLEKLFTSKAGEVGTASKLCHYFLEALKENFKVEKAHQVAMVLDPQLKLRPVPAYQHEEIIARACEMATDPHDGGQATGGGSGGEDVDGPSTPKRLRVNVPGGGVNTRGVVAVSSEASSDESQTQVRQEVFQYLAEPLLQGTTPDLFHYWSTAVGDRFPRLARLALWLLAVPAVGIRSECVSVCEQSLAMKRRQQVTTEEMSKLIFLRSNMA